MAPRADTAQRLQAAERDGQLLFSAWHARAIAARTTLGGAELARQRSYGSEVAQTSAKYPWLESSPTGVRDDQQIPGD